MGKYRGCILRSTASQSKPKEKKNTVAHLTKFEAVIQFWNIFVVHQLRAVALPVGYVLLKIILKEYYVLTYHKIHYTLMEYRAWLNVTIGYLNWYLKWLHLFFKW